MPPDQRITSARVRSDFNEPAAVMHYARAAHQLGLWRSEVVLIERFLPDRGARLLEAGCGAGRATLGLWDLGFRGITAFDFAAGPLDQARSLATLRGVDAGPTGITFVLADATDPDLGGLAAGPAAGLPGGFDGALFLFNGLMQIPGRENRRQALRSLARACRPGAPLLFTTHDREHSPEESALWRLEALRWASGAQDPRLVEFGDRYFADEAGRTFMHLPDREEVLGDLAASGWTAGYDAMRREIAAEPAAVRNFADECRFWVARRS